MEAGCGELWEGKKPTKNSPLRHTQTILVGERRVRKRETKQGKLLLLSFRSSLSFSWESNSEGAGGGKKVVNCADCLFSPKQRGGLLKV